MVKRQTQGREVFRLQCRCDLSNHVAFDLHLGRHLLSFGAVGKRRDLSRSSLSRRFPITHFCIQSEATIRLRSVGPIYTHSFSSLTARAVEDAGAQTPAR